MGMEDEFEKLEVGDKVYIVDEPQSKGVIEYVPDDRDDTYQVAFPDDLIGEFQRNLLIKIR